MTDDTDNKDQTGQRISKALSHAGLCSRREAERWIADGRIAVNGTVLDTPAVVVTETDVITVDGEPLPDKPTPRLWRYHKPAGLITSHNDPQGRPTVFDELPDGLPRVISVGRLDLNSEGLLLLTNDGDLARSLELPSRGWTRRYRVRVHGKVDEDKLRSLKKGVEVEGIRYGSIDAKFDKEQGSNAWLTVTLTEGKNREIRKVMEHIGLRVNRLLRISYGPFQLGTLEKGEVEEIRRKILRDQLGLKVKESQLVGRAKAKAKRAYRGKPGGDKKLSLNKSAGKPRPNKGPNKGPRK